MFLSIFASLGLDNSSDSFFGYHYYYKQLLDEVFMISRIIKVAVWVINRSRRPRVITLTKSKIIIDITKIESNDCVTIIY